jgi:hypothetical protein
MTIKKDINTNLVIIEDNNKKWFLPIKKLHELLNEQNNNNYISNYPIIEDIENFHIFCEENCEEFI